MLGAGSRYKQTATQVMAYLTNAESELQLARNFNAVPANKMAIQRAGDEGLAIITHFAKQAELGQGLPATPNWVATWAPVQSLLKALWAGEPVETALETAQREAERSISALSVP
jgi:maltose-binding protein MalE